MIRIYGECSQHSVQSELLYRSRYPERRPPSRRMFSRLVSTLRDTGSLKPWTRHRRKSRKNEIAEEAILASVADNPQVGTRQLENEFGIPKSSAHRILKSHKFHPYHVNLHQELHGFDFQNRVQFCQ
jgi:hypothetical protein